jgi:hypothetical protein
MTNEEKEKINKLAEAFCKIETAGEVRSKVCDLIMRVVEECSLGTQQELAEKDFFNRIYQL